jgi:hypothetical protein
LRTYDPRKVGVLMRIVARWRPASSPIVFASRRSSRYTMPSRVSIPALERNTRDVRIVRMPQRSIAAAIASCPAVKFRLTGTFSHILTF